MSIFGKLAIGPSVLQGYLWRGSPLYNSPFVVLCAFAKSQKKEITGIIRVSWFEVEVTPNKCDTKQMRRL